MKVFYVLAVAVLMSFFGVGCTESDSDRMVIGEGDELPVASVYSAVQGEVKMESGELKATLKVSECLGVFAKDLAGLKVSHGDTVFCGEGAPGGQPCTGHLKVIFCDEDEVAKQNCEEGEKNTRKLIASNVSCKPDLVLAKEEETPDPSTDADGGTDAGGAADAGSGAGVTDPGSATDSGSAS